MQASPTLDTAGTAPRAATRAPAAGRRVIDAPTRMAHWLFAFGFLGAYVTAESERWRLLHVTLGYIVAGVLVFRLLYGLFGPRASGLGVLANRFKGFVTWLRTTVQMRPTAASHWRQGLTVTLGAGIVAMLLLVLPLTLSGYATYEEWGGPWIGEWLEETHEFFANALLALVLAHLALIAALSWVRRRNQAMPMITGRTEGQGPDLVKANRAWLAGLLLLAVLAFGAWQWQSSPQGLLPDSSVTGHRHGDRHGDDD